jgi:hypothetical protein
MKLRNLVFVALWSLSWSCHAGDYFRQSFFDYPDPTTAPRVTASCSQMGSMDVPCGTWAYPLRMCRAETCTGHTYVTELLRVAPTFVVSGPDSPDEAVKNAVTGIAAGCAATAVSAAQGAAAVTPSPEPSARIAAALAAGATYFQSCISTVNAVAIVSGIVNQLRFKIETPTHWAKL